MSAREYVQFLNNEVGAEYSDYDCNYTLMQMYAMHCLNKMENDLLAFRNKILLNGGMTDFKILAKFDEHFGIVEADKLT